MIHVHAAALVLTIYLASSSSALALSLPQNIVDPSSLFAANNGSTTSLDFIPGAGGNVDCNSNTYGWDFKVKDCAWAVDQMVADKSLGLVYAMRDARPRLRGYTSLPRMWMSTTGTCAITLTSMRPKSEEIEHVKDVSVLTGAAKTILWTCILGKSDDTAREGGAVQFLGRAGGLIVKITKNWNTDKIQCVDDGDPFQSWPSLIAACQPLLDAMPVSYNLQKFGPAGGSGVTRQLPWSMEKSSADSPPDAPPACKVTLSATHPQQQSWAQGTEYDIWYAATTIASMCWWQKKSGIAVRLGLNGAMTLTLAPVGGGIRLGGTNSSMVGGNLTTGVDVA